MTVKVGSLFAGYEGLGLALEEVLGDVELAWVSEWDAAPSRILAHRYPHVPNLGDVTKVDWSSLEPVDVITGGSPCQDLSTAGARKGMTEGTRSNLWVAMREAIATIRPSFVLWENVRGAYSATASSSLGSDPRRLAGVRRRSGGDPLLRALGRVLGDLADIGYDAQWQGLLAADPRVGACHPRFRVFLGAFPRELDRRELLEHLGVLGSPQDADESTRRQRGLPGSGEAEGGRARPDARRRGRDLLPTPRATDGEKGGPKQRGSSGDLMLPSAVAQLPDDAQLLGTPVARDGKGVSHDTPRLQAAARRGKVEAQLLLLPTPVAAEGEKASLSGSARQRVEDGHQPFLTHAIGDVTRGEADRLLPTPTTSDGTGARSHTGGNPNLAGVTVGYHPRDLERLGDRARPELLLPTPVTTDAFGAARHTTTTGVAHPGTSLTDWTRIIEVQTEADGEELLPTPRAGNGMSVPLRPHADDVSRLEDAVAVHLLPTPMVGGGEASHGQISGQYREAMAAAFARWGDYAPAITRWETVTGRPAPEPTQWSESYKRERSRRLAGEDKRPVGRRGSLKPRSQLSARFVEWMMGLPEGWVTDVPDVSRNQALKALGNGVVPQQAATALAIMLGDLIAELEEAEAS